MEYAFDLLDGKDFNLVTLVLAGVGAALSTIATHYNRRALFPPKRQLTCFIDGCIDITPSAWMIDFRLQNTGRHAVASEHFDRDRPLEIDLGVPIEKLWPGKGAASSFRYEGSKIYFGPEFIDRKKSVRCGAAIKGQPTVTVHTFLVDAKVKVKWVTPEAKKMNRSCLLGCLVPIIFYALFAIAALNGAMNR
ncbi:hypothetical protein [Streptomyces luteogriseus]|uniref:hypothetical protein n=1 Tax=Streptomyces luteogriseus TaxID=68233 RepID=UPI00367D68C6